MGIALLGDVLKNWHEYQLDDELYLPAGMELSLETQVNVLPFDPARERIFEGRHYLLGIEQVRDVILGLESQIGREATMPERLYAVAYYARYDAFINPMELVGSKE